MDRIKVALELMRTGQRLLQWVAIAALAVAILIGRIDQSDFNEWAVKYMAAVP